MAAPALEPTVNRAVIAEVLGELVPLASGAEAEDDTVDRRSPINPAASTVGLGLRRRILPEDRLDPSPEFVIDFPDRIKGLILSVGPSHPCVS
jgi:hypothetical protein